MWFDVETSDEWFNSPEIEEYHKHLAEYDVEKPKESPCKRLSVSGMLLRIAAEKYKDRTSCSYTVEQLTAEYRKRL